MLKNILNLEGAQEISKNEQKAIKGGITRVCNDAIVLTHQCYWSNGAACSPGYAKNTAPCNHTAICCETLI